ncbi:MAG: peptidylprolyl isomerase [Wenzhouxiangella sp.]|jgi:peptidyl-prolyl cis-trans isomerase A (cyclophilin A)|nr:peptidylprolyl isomerase [Wenzhouxiangella sp.]
MDTDRGPILLELDPESAPGHVENFLAYVNEGFYDGLIFHRSIEGFVVQGGGYDGEFRQRQPTRDPIAGAPNNGLDNEIGTVALALPPNNIDSGQNQFFINLARNDFLDAEFTVFGRVVSGLQVLRNANADRVLSKLVGASRFDDVPVRPPLVRRAVETRGFPIMPLHTGSWFDPATNGTGFNIEVANDASNEQGPLLLVYWYDFRDGRLIWATGLERFDYRASEVTVELISVDAPGEAVDFHNPPEFEAFETWGSVTVRFNDCRTGVFRYDTVVLGSGEIEFTRLTLPDQAKLHSAGLIRSGQAPIRRLRRQSSH